MTDATGAAELRPLQIEMNGINVISESERKGHPRDLFWPWFAANISVLGISYGAFVLGFGISFWQALIVGVVGIVLSFLACGFISVAGKRGSAPTMVLSRAAFGVNGNKLPAAISWLLTVGWETVLVILATLLPTWFLVPFAIVAVLGLIGGSVLDIYSSGLAMLSLGVRIPRYVAALIDGTVMTLGAIYVVFVAHNFIGQFEGFLITLGVPIAAWCGVMLADIALRRRDYAEPELFSPSGRYGDIRWVPVAAVVIATALGWGLVTNTGASWLTWQGYLLGPFGLGGKTGAWAFANLGVLIALAIGFVAHLVFGRADVRAEEAAPLPLPATAEA
jgi:purine-cytosine permease-like protein